jgi:hypothetical protein
MNNALNNAFFHFVPGHENHENRRLHARRHADQNAKDKKATTQAIAWRRRRSARTAMKSVRLGGAPAGGGSTSLSNRTG